MIYFTTKDELEHMRSLLRTFESIIAIESTTSERLREAGTEYLTPYGMFKHIRKEAAKNYPEYQELRTAYAKMIPRANQISKRENVPWYKEGIAALIEGGMPFQGSIFEFVLKRPSAIIDIDTDVRDTVNQIIGILEHKEIHEFRQIINPLYWLKVVIIFIVRLPYSILELSGFDVEKIQDYLIFRTFQLLYVIALILILVRFGLIPIIDLKSLLIP